MQGMEARPGRGSKKLQQAADLLRAELAAGDQYTKDLELKARKRGLGVHTLRLAKTLVGARAYQTVKEDAHRGPWMWSLRPDAPSGPADTVALIEQASHRAEQPEALVAATGDLVQPEIPLELKPADPPPADPEVVMPSNEEIGKVLEGLQGRLTMLEGRAVPVERLKETVEQTLKEMGTEVREAKASATLKDVQETVADLAAKVQPVDPRLLPLAEHADTLAALCALHPELCKHLEQHAPPGAPEKPEEPVHVHDALLKALNEAGMQHLGRTPTWPDLLDACPGGDCAKGAVEAIARRPELLKHLVAQEGVADTLIGALKESGKLVVEPEEPPPPEREEVPSGSERGWFGRIPVAQE